MKTRQEKIHEEIIDLELRIELVQLQINDLETRKTILLNRKDGKQGELDDAN